MTTYAINMTTNATTEYDNFTPNSMCLGHDGAYYFMDSTGLYRLGGDDDDGDPIECMLGLGLSDLGSSLKKRLRAIYLAVVSPEPMLVRLQEGQEQYELLAEGASDELEQQKVKVPRGARANFFGFEVYNTGGSEVYLSEVEVISSASKTRRVGS